MWWILGAIFIIFSICALWSKTVIKRYGIESDKLSEDIKIVQISDLHSIFHGKNQHRLTEKIDAIEPDVVVITGDLFDYARKDDAAFWLLRAITKYPCFFSFGNHEYRSGRFDKYVRRLNELGIVVLEDEIFDFGKNITISGAGEPRKTAFYDKSYDFVSSMEDAFSSIDKKNFNILLAHNNAYYREYLSFGFDLILSGHAHGGQFRLPPVINGFYVRGQGFFPKHCGGIYRNGNSVHIVSRGVSRNPRWCPRIFNPTELVVIDIKAK